MTMNPFEQNEHLLHFLTSQVEREVIDYIRQEMQHDAPDSIPTEEELFAFFQSPDEPTKLDAYQQMLATDKLLEYAEISLRTPTTCQSPAFVGRHPIWSVRPAIGRR